MKLWIRLGDTDEYHSFDDIQALKDHLKEMGVSAIIGWITGQHAGGFTTAQHRGFNYISCYWGDDDAQFVHTLSKHEKGILTQ